MRSPRFAWRAPTVAVRVNAVGSPWFEDDVAAVVGGAGRRADTVVLPKVESGGTVVEAVDALDRAMAGRQSDPAGGAVIGFEALIETALGLVRVEEIAAATASAGGAHLRSRRLRSFDGPPDGGHRRHRPGLSGRSVGIPARPDRRRCPRLRSGRHRRPVRRVPRPRGPGQIGSTRAGARFFGQVGDPSGSDRDVPRRPSARQATRSAQPNERSPTSTVPSSQVKAPQSVTVR